MQGDRKDELPTIEERERMERLRSTLRGRKALYEGLAAIPDAADCHECPGTYGQHHPDCVVGAEERWAERVGRYIEARDRALREGMTMTGQYEPTQDEKRIVEWLRVLAETCQRPKTTTYWFITDAIMRGEHREDA